MTSHSFCGYNGHIVVLQISKLRKLLCILPKIYELNVFLASAVPFATCGVNVIESNATGRRIDVIM